MLQIFRPQLQRLTGEGWDPQEWRIRDDQRNVDGNGQKYNYCGQRFYFVIRSQQTYYHLMKGLYFLWPIVQLEGGSR